VKKGNIIKKKHKLFLTKYLSGGKGAEMKRDIIIVHYVIIGT